MFLLPVFLVAFPAFLVLFVGGDAGAGFLYKTEHVEAGGDLGLKQEFCTVLSCVHFVGRLIVTDAMHDAMHVRCSVTNYVQRIRVG